MLKDNIKKMDLSKNPALGMDIVIVTVSNDQQESWWQERLEKTRGQILKNTALPIVVSEDWPMGAGNGLGSLYAYQKAREKGYVLHKVDIFQKQREGFSIALYHTAGEGKRLYPLTASEYGLKGAVKLPSMIRIDGQEEPITMLEAAIRQTNIYAPSRKGRFSVFWADQLFIPSGSSEYSSRHHADILVKLIPMPTEEEWSLKDLSKYGLITLNKQGQAQHIDKVEYSILKQFIATGKMSISGGLGISLGSFSLSAPLTFAFLQEFQPELIQKNAKMDSDPYFWMPLTLDQASYIQSVGSKISAEDAKNHHLRMQYFKNHFISKHPETSLFGIVDIGMGSFWWDFGNIDSYVNNLLKLTKNTVEGYLLREFFRLEQNFGSSTINNHVGNEKINSSVVVSSAAQDMVLENCVVIGSAFKNVKASNCLLYNVLEDEDILFHDQTVRADTFLPSQNSQVKIYAERLQDAKQVWNTILPQNSESYEVIQEKLKKEDFRRGIKEFTQLKNRQFHLSEV